MTVSALAEPLLDDTNACFMQRSVSIFVASRDAALHPASALACGCRVAPDRSEVTVFLNHDQAADVLANLKATRVIAVNFSQPSTHRSIQLKGCDARAVPVLPDDLMLIAAYRNSFVADLALIHFPESYARTIIPAPNDSLAAICFTPTQMFDQTPGHNAGHILK